MLCAACSFTLVVTGIYFVIAYVQSTRRVSGTRQKAVFITGCDSGFGRALAKRLDGLGVPVFAGCLTTDGASHLRQECSQRAQAFLLDVTNSESIKKAFKLVKEALTDGTGTL